MVINLWIAADRIVGAAEPRINKSITMPTCPACKCSFDVTAGRTIPWECPACSERFVSQYGELQLIAAGAMGDVYQGCDYLVNRRPVAIKMPRSNEPEAARRFQREIEASKRLRHENIVSAYEHGEECGRLFLVMEFVAGERLDRVVDQQHPLAPRRVANYLHDLASGLDHAQRSQVLNRDIKPSNILITPDDRAKILDYGLALITDLDQAGQDVTRSGMALGTPAFSAPEQFFDPHRVTIAADVYSLGCTIFFCLTRRQPFFGLDTEDLQRQHAKAPRPSTRQLRPDVANSFDRLIRRMMAVSPDQRPQPAEIRDHVAFLLSDGQHLDATPVAAGAGEMFDVKCPLCGKLYHVDQYAFGKVIRCHKRDCKPFKVEPHLIVSPTAGPRAEPLDFVEWTAADDDESYDADWVRADEEFKPSDPSGIDTAWRLYPKSDTHEHVDTPPTSSVPEEPPEEPHWDPDVDPAVESATDGDPMVAEAEHFTEAMMVEGLPALVGKSPRHLLWVWAIVGVLSLGSAVATWTIYKQRNPPPNVVWERVVKDEFGLRHWEDAKKSFEAFQRDLPADPNAVYAPFFIDLCNARLQTAQESPEASLKRFQGIYRAYRDQDVYGLYVNYLYDLTQDFVKRLLEEGGNKHDPEMIRQAWTAFELYSTVAKSMKDDWVEERVKEIETLVKTSERRVSREVARATILADLETLQRPDSKLDADMVYARVDGLKALYPELGRDRQLINALSQAEQFEVKQVTYERVEQGDGETNESAATSDGTKTRTSTLLLLSDAATAPTDHPANDGQVFLALARGVLYAFDSHGNFLWARRLGLDSDGLPVKIEETPTSPPLLLAASADEGRLLALEAWTGRLRWSYKLDGDIFTAPTILSDGSVKDQAQPGKRGLLAAANGDIHVLELVLGKRLGTFV